MNAVMNDTRRLQLEDRLLRRYFSTFRIQDLDGGPNLGAVGALQTNSDRIYRLWIPLKSFPAVQPQMFVISPTLYDVHGVPLNMLGVRADMHLLSPDQHGHVQICHYNENQWRLDVTLYKVVMKGRIWLEAYEGHLRTGNSIDHYLRHMLLRS